LKRREVNSRGLINTLFRNPHHACCSNFRVLDIPPAAAAAARIEKEKSITTAAHSSAVAAALFICFYHYSQCLRGRNCFIAVATERENGHAA
jgi:hypothetical protein